jgi:transcriptional regulator with XRE-family HTH domain
MIAADQGPVVLSALLRGDLVRLRKERGLTQEQVAAELEWSASKLIRVEGGRSSITKVDLDALLDTYTITDLSLRERMQALNRGARERGWWDAYHGELPPTYVDFVGYEAGASFIRQFQGSAVPGLLQTSAYSRELTAAWIEDAERLDTVVRLRMLRQTELAKRNPPPRRYFILDEAVIRRHVGIQKDRGVMPDQLRQIAARARDDERITVRVIPFEAGGHPGLTGPFTLLEFDGDMPDILYLDSGRDIAMIRGNDERVGEYAEAFEKLVNAALPASDSIEFMVSVAEEMS